MTRLLLILWLCLFAVNAYSAEWWVDNSREGKDGMSIGIGTEKDPLNTVTALEKLIIPGDVHTIHLSRTNIPYQGGIGGKGLKSWIFKNCKIIEYGAKDKSVIYTSCRKIPVSALTGDAKADAELFEHLNMKGRRLYRDGDNLVLTRPFYLKSEDQDKGYALDDVKKTLAIDVERVPVKSDFTARRVEIKEVKETAEVDSKVVEVSK